MSTQCGHLLCKPCKEDLFKSNNKEKQLVECPVCRKNLKESMIHDIFI